jgi:hypothetical protein
MQRGYCNGLPAEKVAHSSRTGVKSQRKPWLIKRLQLVVASMLWKNPPPVCMEVDMFALNRRRVMLWISGCLLLASPVYAEIYRWTDANGKVHFSDQPFGKQQVEKVEVKPQTVAKPDPELEAYRQQTREQLRIAEEERRAQQAVAQNQRDVSPQQCASARDELQASMASSLHYDLDKNGNRVYSSSEEIEAYREKIRQFIARNCR